MKKITYSFLSLLMLLLAMPAGLLARTTVTFDFAANPWKLPLSEGSDKLVHITQLQEYGHSQLLRLMLLLSQHQVRLLRFLRQSSQSLIQAKKLRL